jgi:NADH-quinone oxidoreductase subunit C
MPEDIKGNDESVKQQLAAGNQQLAKEEPAAISSPPSAKSADANAPGTDKPGTPAAAKPAATPAAPTPGVPVIAKPTTPDGTAGVAKPAAPAGAKPAVPPKPEGPKPEPWNSPIAQRLRQSYGSGIKEASTYVGQNYLVVDKAIIHDVLTILCDDEGFDYCVDVTAVHYPKKDEQFEVIYVLYSFRHNQRVRVKTAITDGEKIATVSDIWPTANWLEREVFDMFGIEFGGHPDPRRILLPEDWKGHPLRKDHDILKQDTEWVHIHLGIESGQ